MSEIKENEIILDVKRLRTYFYTSRGMVKAVNNVSFNIKRSEILAIVGESGAGKSVLAFSILMLVPYPGKILTGEINFKGEDLLQKTESKMRNIRGKGISIIFQDPMSCLNPVFTIEEQLTSGILTHEHISKQGAREKAIQMLKL